MDLDFPPRPQGRLDRLGLWMRARKWRQWLVLYPLVMILTVIIMIAWIAVAFALGSTDRNSGAVALNYVLVGFIATVGLLIMHPAMYRWYWHIERKRRAGDLPAGGPRPRLRLRTYGSATSNRLAVVLSPSALARAAAGRRRLALLLHALQKSNLYCAIPDRA